MAMMMTGRVLLVCALCVLWCGAGGRCDEGEAAVHGVPPDVSASGTEGGLGGTRNAAPAPDSQIQSSGEEQQHKSREGRPALPEGSSEEEEEEEETVEDENLEEVTERGEEGRHEDGQDANERDGSQTSGVLTKQKETPSPSTPAAPAEEGNQNASPQAPSVDSHGGGGTDRIEGSILKAPSSGVALQHAGDASTNQKNKSLETGKHSENTITGGPVPSQVKAPKESIKDAENHSVTGEDTASNQVVGRGTTEYEAQQRALATQDRSSVSFPDSEKKWQTTPQETPKTQVPPSATEPSSREGQPPTATTDSQTPNAQEHKRLLLPKKTEYNAPEHHSEDILAEQQGQATATENLTENAPATNQAEKTASPNSTSGGGEARSTADENTANAQRPNPNESHEDLEGSDTHPAPTASEAAPQTAIKPTANTTDTATPAENDSSTAFSHTTSPLLLLLLVVACAAAAAVVAA
ncbi:Mucin-associated surface protein (MASP) [Trypanosoma cruzi]|uniref:Mucin-associated surface protein (MASP), putative n=2 Tax=Trypanosoma cruzi TaxID=5693 RepID=Q4DZC1_TRYCC|nr:mucin-associated surface protein (MASP), putative [Trypanosoma cruzi]EAN97871.1 mucin-associated surface protein (MASP), putative [Trypanosoma cruzi]PWV04042.1 Mucin-associated surface protein (MASP) [Trypanosoma cruzi]|eukprot:XP_819722.1 mucin-associated surface protein (MASP) [Trypanosoma cruzi strain CL Brener]